MSKVKVLFFAADPLSASPTGPAPRLLLDEDIRKMRERVHAAKYRDALEFDYRLAARSEDLRQALEEVLPQVVHFSGHGARDGLVLVGRGGDPHLVGAKALKQLFQAFRGEIRLVVLNACLSLPQAKAIAQVVGCAIGTRREISDEAAITFGSSFYNALAFGHSVQAAFDKACAALATDHPGEEDCPQLVRGRGVDPAALVLVSPTTGEPVPPADAEKVGRARRMVAPLGIGLAAVVALKLAQPAIEVQLPLAWQPGCGWITADGGSPATTAAHPAARGGAAGPHSPFATARALRAQGNDAAALPWLRRAATAGDYEAMGYLGVALLYGEGIPRSQPDSGIAWIQKAAYKHDPHAMTAYGYAYEEGIGVRQSRTSAEDWYYKAVRAGWPEAMRALGNLNRDRGDYAAAFELYHKAVRAGSVDARADAGRMYADGLGVRRYPAEAVCLYRNAAKAGSSLAMYELGRSYQEGSGVSRDLDLARHWYLQASGGGYADAMDAVGALYLDGLGVKRDSAAAIGWFRRARNAGSLVAEARLQELGRE